MYQDVNVVDVNSDSEPNLEKKNKNKNSKADIEHFFTPIKHIKGDKQGRHLCKTCAYVINCVSASLL
jgi:hypothetical protein